MTAKWIWFKGPIGDAIGPMRCETLPYPPEFEAKLAEEKVMAEEPLRDPISPTHFGDFNDNPAFEGPDNVGKAFANRWRDHWYDPVLRLLLCRLLGKHRWFYWSALARPSGSDWRKHEWWQCRLCGERCEPGPIQPKKPWPRGDH